MPGSSRHIFVKDNLAYVTCWTGGLQFVDISNPASPFIAASIPTNDAGWGIFADDNYAYFADWEGGLRIIQIWQ